MIERWASRRGMDEERLRGAQGLFASAVGVAVNALLFAVKLAVGALSGSVAITADAFNNLSDASSSVISLVGFKLAGKPADEEHPFGHGRYEYLCALLVAVMILVIGCELLVSSVRQIISPKAVSVGAAGFAVLVLSIAAKLWLAAFNRRMSGEIDSGALAASAEDSRNDALATSAVLASALIGRATGLRLDGAMGAAVALFILVSGGKLLRETLRPVLGAMPSQEELEEIRQRVLEYPGVLGAHDLMVHDYGPGRRYATVHVEMSAGEDPMASHEVIDRIERDFVRDRGLHLVVHYDPVATNDPRVPALFALLEREAAGIDPRLSVHDLRIASCETGARVAFDCVVPYDLPLSGEEIERRLCQAVERAYPRYTCAVTLEHGHGQDGV